MPENSQVFFVVIIIPGGWQPVLHTKYNHNTMAANISLYIEGIALKKLSATKSQKRNQHLIHAHVMLCLTFFMMTAKKMLPQQLHTENT